MIRIVIADDEKIIREGLKHLLNWGEINAEIIGAASDGKEAFELCMNLKPELLITDIRMPEMDGLELIRRLREEGLPVRCIILSGYQEFEYAKKALEFGAVRYLIKPIEEEELKKLVIAVWENVNNESIEKARISELKIKLNETEAYQRNLWLQTYVSGEERDRKRAAEKLKDYGFSRMPALCQCFIAELEVDSCGKNFNHEDRELIRFAAANIIDELVGKCGQGYVFYTSDTEIACIKAGKQEKDATDRLLRDILGSLKNFLGIQSTIGLGAVYHNEDAAFKSYREAKSALKYKLLMGKGGVIRYSEVSSSINKKSFTSPLNIERKLVNSVICSDLEGLHIAVEELFSCFRPETGITPEAVLEECKEVLMLIKKSAEDIGVEYGGLLEKDEMNGFFNSIAGITELKNEYLKLLESIAKEVARNNLSGAKAVIAQIKEYIDLNYAEQITLNTISERFYINSAYVSRLFKKELSENFIDYLTSRRMEEAKKLLLGTSLKIYEISERIGYSNPKYFSQVFEKAEGIGPREFRERNTAVKG